MISEEKILKMAELIKHIEVGSGYHVQDHPIHGKFVRRKYQDIFGDVEAIRFSVWPNEETDLGMDIFPTNRDFAMIENGKYIELQPMSGGCPAENSVMKQLDMTKLV
ncbi:hypothetical protein [Pseudaestuariivita rosea]|uniref:hypothetical protein n=1 Tax=Pseudaestuariivita rosea TaxID=2763263 RepID=UPI001ABA585D|nr:hypothetical protein [Pseudaestuariivita rosea]